MSRKVELVCTQEFYSNGQLIREVYYLNGKYHNEAGPAYRSWHKNGQIEREGYYLDGQNLSKQEWESAINKQGCEGRIVEIDGVKYKLSRA